MGHSSWSDDYYKARASERAAKGVVTFAHDAEMKATPRHEQKVHPSLDPKGVKIRESRDGAAHPNALAIAFILDVTGSMRTIPMGVQKELPKLMNLLIDKGVTPDPQILFGAVGDATNDRGSLQIGQYESGIEMEGDLTNFWLEGGGGGSREESYQNAIYFFARHTALDCHEKRGKKGYLFLMGDEMPYDKVRKSEITTLLDDGIEADIPTAQIVAEAREKYHVFFIIPAGSSGASDARMRQTWVTLLGEDHVIRLDSVNNVCETIAAIVGLIEGTATLEGITEGMLPSVARVVTTATQDIAVKHKRVGTPKPEATVARL